MSEWEPLKKSTEPSLWEANSLSASQETFYELWNSKVSWDSSVGITTRYELDGPGSESPWERIYHAIPTRP